MIHQVKSFSFVFLENLGHHKLLSKLTDLYLFGFLCVALNLENSTTQKNLNFAQPRGVVHQPSPRRFWQSSRQTEEVQCLSTSVEERDCFRPPPGHPSQL